MMKLKKDIIDKELRDQIRKFCPIADTCNYIDVLECAKCLTFFIENVNEALKEKVI